MSGLPVRIEPEAQDDYRAAMRWYESQVSGLSHDFEVELDRTFQKIILNPLLYRIAYKRYNLRRVFVSRFPFKVFYVVTSQDIVIKAILHNSQDDWIIGQRTRNL